MMMPVTGVGNPSSVARRPSSVPCRPAPNINTPIPRSSGHVAVIELTWARDTACQIRRRCRSCSPGRASGSALPDAAENAGEVFRQVDGLDVFIGKALRLAVVEQNHVCNAFRQLARIGILTLGVLVGPGRVRRTDKHLRL